MNNELITQDPGDAIERVLISGDLSKLSAENRIQYYREVCRSLGLNPLSRPFDYITLNGKLTLYAKRDATDQLRKIHNVSVVISGRERVEDVYIVTARASMPDGRTDESTGCVSVINLKGDALANALMKAETKSKRRVTLSIVGLGWLDETEIETIPDAKPKFIDTQTGEVIDAPTQPVKPNGNADDASKSPKGDKPATDKPYRFPSTAAEKFYQQVQKATDSFYKGPAEMVQVIGGWFNFGSQDLLDEKLSAAIDHARQMREAKQEPVVESQEVTA